MLKNDEIMEGMYVEVRVGNILKQYIVNSFRSDTVPLHKGSVVMNIIRPHLELCSCDELEEFDEETREKEVIRLELPNERKKVYHQKGHKIYFCNTLWRNRLSSKGQKEVKTFFRNTFMQAVRIYIDADIERQEIMKAEGKKNNDMMSAIQAFMDKYNFEYTKKDLHRIKQDWYRHRDDVEFYRISPIVY